MYSLFTHITVAQIIRHKICSHVGLFWIITPYSLVGEYKCVRVPARHTTRCNKTLHELRYWEHLKSFKYTFLFNYLNMHILIKLLHFDTTHSCQVDTDPSEEHAASTFRAEWLGLNLTLKCPLPDFVSHMYKKSSCSTKQVNFHVSSVQAQTACQEMC
jgi:hypothetical protein